MTCPPSIFEADLRAEIWRFDPATGRWERVYRSPAVANPRAAGHRVARDIGYRGMAVVRDGRGRPALYVGALSPDEIVPELARPQPPRLLRTTDGETFRPMRGRPGVIHTHEGARRPVGFRSLAVAGGELYVTASAGLTGNGVVLRVDRLGGRRARFRQVSPPELSVFELQTFRGDLHAGTGDAAAGYGVWRLAAGAWRPLVQGGAGRGSTITSVVSMAVYRDRLYVGASGWGTAAFPPSELIRIAPDGSWTLVAGNPRPDADGVRRTPVSGLPDGFGNAFNSHFWRMQPFRGALVLGTNDWSWSVETTPDLRDELRPELGFDLYATCDGDEWFDLTRDALGRGGQDFGVRTMAATPAGLFIGTTNHVRGGAVYRSRRDLCAGRAPVPARPSARAAAAPRSGLRACPSGADVLAGARPTRDQMCGQEGTAR